MVAERHQCIDLYDDALLFGEWWEGKVDPRGNLFLRYLEYVRALKPVALLVETVPDALRYAGHNIMQEMCDTLAPMGYEARYTLINTAFHGVPQMRDRVYLIAYRKELKAKIQFPKPTHHVVLPKGYDHTRAVALRYVDLLSAGYLPSVTPKDTLPKAITAREAISDLPKVRGTSVKSGAKRFSQSTRMRYRKIKTISAYAEVVRTWPAFESDGGVIDHAIRYLPRDHLVFAAMRPGAEYPEAKNLAIKIVNDKAIILGVDRKTKKYKEMYKSVVPPYDETKFANKWWKIREDFPVRTLLAHLGKDSYSHIHYDDRQARTISVREAARLQGFPDGFKFAGTMNPAFKQIGNAVAPLMAAAIAEVMHATLLAGAKTLSNERDVVPASTQRTRDGHGPSQARNNSNGSIAA